MADLATVNAKTLEDAGLTDPARSHFQNVVADYADELLRRTRLQADADRTGGDDKAEAIAKHVRDAAYDLASKPVEKPVSGWSVAGQVGEYLFTAGAGLAAGHLDQQAGQIGFGVCLSLATILLVVRLIRAARK